MTNMQNENETDKQPPNTRFKFLLIEDDDDHAKIIERNLQREGSGRTELIRFRDGLEAIDYLQSREKSQPDDLPHVILLDLKLPKMDGHDVLSTIKNDDHLMNIPVVILTTSDAEADKTKAYRHHANSYLVKPLERNAFRDMIQNLNNYWSVWSRLAPPPGIEDGDLLNDSH